ncbi:hypothetical protein D3C80_1101030 [compost metagenome]
MHLPPLSRQPELPLLVGTKALFARTGNIGQTELIVLIRPHLDGGGRGQHLARAEQNAALVGGFAALLVGEAQAELAVVTAPEPLLHPEQGDLQFIPAQGVLG